MRTIQVKCPCGRLLRVGEQAMGKRVCCPACGSVHIIPERPTATPESTSLKGAVDGVDDAVKTPAEPLKIQTPVWLLYFGLLTAAAILWGTLATWMLRDRTAHMEDALRRVDAAEKAAKVSIEQAEAIKSQAIKDVEAIKREAEAIKREAEALRQQAEATRVREEEKVLKLHPNFRKLVPGEISVRESCLESFTIENGVVHVKLMNNSRSPIIPVFSIAFFDKHGAETDHVDFTWLITTIDPGQTSSDEKPIRPNLARPVYYTLSLKGGARLFAADNAQPAEPTLVVGDQVVLQDQGNSRVFLATSNWAWDEMIDAENAKSQDLMARLIRQGKVIAPKSGTVCVIVKNGFLSKLVLIKEGAYADQEGWVQMEFVKPFKGR